MSTLTNDDSGSTTALFNATATPFNVKNTAYAGGALGNGTPNAAGHDDTAAIQAAFNAALAARVAITVGSTPPAASFLGTVPTVYFPPGIYDITGEITVGGTLIVKGDHAIIRQNTSTNRIFINDGVNGVNNYAFIEGMSFFGGTRHIDFRNANTDAVQFQFKNCVFQNATDWAVYTEGRSAPRASSINLNVVNGSVTFNDSLNQVILAGDVGTFIRIYDAAVAGGYAIYKIASFNAGLHTGTFERPYVGTSTFNSYDVGDFHMSTTMVFDGCQFMGNARMIHNLCDCCLLTGETWAEMNRGTVTTPGLLVANTCQIRHLGESLIMDHFFGVPSAGNTGSGTRPRLANVRWIDQSGLNVTVTNSRIGGEENGMSLVWFYTPFAGGAANTGGSVIVRNNYQLFVGDTAATTSDYGLIHLRVGGAIPQFISVEGNRGLYAAPIVQNSGSISPSLATFYAGVSNSDRYFRYKWAPNLTFENMPSPPVPVEMLRYSNGNQWGSATLSFGTVNNGAASAIQTITVYGANGGDSVSIDSNAIAEDVNVRAWVSAADTVSVSIHNFSGGNLTINSRVIAVCVFKRLWEFDS